MSESLWPKKGDKLEFTGVPQYVYPNYIIADAKKNLI